MTLVPFGVGPGVSRREPGGGGRSPDPDSLVPRSHRRARRGSPVALGHAPTFVQVRSSGEAVTPVLFRLLICLSGQR